MPIIVADVRGSDALVFFRISDDRSVLLTFSSSFVCAIFSVTAAIVTFSTWPFFLRIFLHKHFRFRLHVLVSVGVPSVEALPVRETTVLGLERHFGLWVLVGCILVNVGRAIVDSNCGEVDTGSVLNDVSVLVKCESVGGVCV